MNLAHGGGDSMTASEVADLLVLSKAQVYHLTRCGDIPCCKESGRWYFDRTSLLAWLHGKGWASDEEMMTADAVAEWLGFSKLTIHRWARAGEIPAFKLGAKLGEWLFKRSSIEAWLASTKLWPRQTTGWFGPAHPMWGKRWGEGRRYTDKGYVLVRANDGLYRREHRVVMERILGRPLLPGEVVHHVNGIRDDNRPENLQLFSSEAEHQAFHMRKP